MMEYWLAVMVSLCALWLRVYLHALGQWFLLYAMGVPVFSFSVRYVREGLGKLGYWYVQLL